MQMKQGDSVSEAWDGSHDWLVWAGSGSGFLLKKTSVLLDLFPDP